MAGASIIAARSTAPIASPERKRADVFMANPLFLSVHERTRQAHECYTRDKSRLHGLGGIRFLQRDRAGLQQRLQVREHLGPTAGYRDDDLGVFVLARVRDGE